MEGSFRWSQDHYDAAEEFARSVKVSLLGVTPKGVASFRPGPDSIVEDWEKWMEQIFEPLTGPLFKNAFELGHELKLREIAVLDQALSDALPDISPDLIAASQPFIEGKEKMRGHREWRKYVLKIESGEAPGHLPVMFALHAVLFKLPLISALMAYGWFEWKTGHQFIAKPELAGHVESPSPLFLEIRKSIHRVLSPGPVPFDNGEGLRVV